MSLRSILYVYISGLYPIARSRQENTLDGCAVRARLFPLSSLGDVTPCYTNGMRGSACATSCNEKHLPPIAIAPSESKVLSPDVYISD